MLKLTKLSPNTDLSQSALRSALDKLLVNGLGPSYVDGKLVLQVHPDNIFWALKVQEEFQAALGHRMAIHLTPLGKTDAWALWLYDSCVWSEGA